MIYRKIKVHPIIGVKFLSFYQPSCCIKPYVPIDPQKGSNKRGSTDHGTRYISDSTRARTHNLSHRKRALIPLDLSHRGCRNDER